MKESICGCTSCAEFQSADMPAHASKVKQRTQIEIQQESRIFSEADPGLLWEEITRVHCTQHDIKHQKRYFHEEKDPCHVQHYSPADPDAAAPGEPSPNAEIFKDPHQRFVLLPFDKAVVGDAVNAELKIVLLAERFHFFHKTK